MTRSQPEVPESRRRTTRPLLWALGVSVFLHLLFGLFYTVVELWVARSPQNAPEWAREMVRPTSPAPALSAVPAEPAWQEIPLEFIEVDPANAVEKETKDARFYSNANTVTGQPVPSEKKLRNPEIAGVQKSVPKTFDTVRPAQTEPQEQPKLQEKPAPNETPSPQKQQEARKPQPAGGPRENGETELAVAKPNASVERVQDEQKSAEAQQPGAPRRRPIKRLAEAREQKGVVLGEKMLQEGGTPHFSISPSFDVKSSPFGDYDLRMVAAVQERWWALLEERRYSLERTGKVVLKFNLHGDGTISQLQTVQTDVGETLGFTCEAALLGASPFGRWPTVLKAQALDPREITFTFTYY
jgi:hypothetical protein